MRTNLRILALTLALGPFWFMPAFADTIGQQVIFNINNQFDNTARTSLTATLRNMSTKAYFYVDDIYWQSISAYEQTQLLTNIQTLAQEFDNRIYPISTNFWGSENTPGVDNDVRITILLEELKVGYGGYFDNINSYTQTQAPGSNQREMIILNARALSVNSAKEFLAHEFQHLISNQQKELLRNIADPIWLNEARSEYAASLLNYNEPFFNSNLDRRSRTFLQNPSNSLTDWPNDTKDYAIAAVFGEYLTGRYGPRILSDSIKSNSTGIASLNAFWSANGYQERFTDVFADWMIASYLNKSGDSRFGYATANLNNLRVIPQTNEFIQSGGSYTISASLKSWQPSWFSFTSTQSGNQALKLEIIGTNTFLIPYVVFYSDGTQSINTSLVNSLQTIYIRSNGRQVQRVVLAASPIGSLPERNSESIEHSLTMRTSLVNDSEAQSAVPTITLTPAQSPEMLSTGSLIKRRGSEQEVYVIEGKYKRYLRPEIIALYGHLQGIQPTAVDDSIFHSYIMANYIRHVDQKQVYVVWPDGTKHWLNMSGEYFAQSGRDWGSIFIINDGEFNTYRTGPDITH